MSRGKARSRLWICSEVPVKETGPKGGDLF